LPVESFVEVLLGVFPEDSWCSKR